VSTLMPTARANPSWVMPTIRTPDRRLHPGPFKGAGARPDPVRSCGQPLAPPRSGAT
jgi:hypothetical protein